MRMSDWSSDVCSSDLPFQAHESDYITPDVFVSRKNGRWTVGLNPEHAPKLRLNSRYQGMIRRADNSRDQVVLKQHLQEARYFLNSLEARNETLLRVAQSIVDEQRAFLDYGPEAMRYEERRVGKVWFLTRRSRRLPCN